MPLWKIAAVQMDCKLGAVATNRERIATYLRAAASAQARLAIFPECALTGYAFDNKDEALSVAETIPGPSTEFLAAVCKECHIWAVVGGLERAGVQMFNVAALIGPEGLHAVYRKIHLPFLGVDRFTIPGDQPFAVHDIGGLRVGMNICYDGSFPESSRILMLLGVDLIALPTNWPAGAESTVCHMVTPRALENHLYYAAVNRVGTERQTRYIGQSRIVNVNGDLLAGSGADEETILYAEIDPERARNKKIVRIAGEYELNRLTDRRPEMYGPLTK
jgi:predicted amidohydrolase